MFFAGRGVFWLGCDCIFGGRFVFWSGWDGYLGLVWGLCGWVALIWFGFGGVGGFGFECCWGLFYAELFLFMWVVWVVIVCCGRVFVVFS